MLPQIFSKTSKRLVGLYEAFGGNPYSYGDSMGLLLEVTNEQQKSLKLFYGEENVQFTPTEHGTSTVSITQAGINHISNYVKETGGSKKFALSLNRAILTPFYLYPSLCSVQSGNPSRQWIGQEYEGNINSKFMLKKIKKITKRHKCHLVMDFQNFSYKWGNSIVEVFDFGMSRNNLSMLVIVSPLCEEGLTNLLPFCCPYSKHKNWLFYDMDTALAEIDLANL